MASGSWRWVGGLGLVVAIAAIAAGTRSSVGAPVAGPLLTARAPRGGPNLLGIDTTRPREAVTPLFFQGRPTAPLPVSACRRSAGVMSRKPRRASQV